MNLERMGIPTAFIACDRLVETTGRAAARAHGVPDYPFVVIPYGISDASPDETVKKALNALPEIERRLVGWR